MHISIKAAMMHMLVAHRMPLLDSALDGKENHMTFIRDPVQNDINFMPAENADVQFQQKVHQQVLPATGADTLGSVPCACDTSFKCVLRPYECLHD